MHDRIDLIDADFVLFSVTQFCSRGIHLTSVLFVFVVIIVRSATQVLKLHAVRGMKDDQYFSVEI